jgi:hypothetical protein
MKGEGTMNRLRGISQLLIWVLATEISIAAQTYDLKPQFREGQSWAFEQSGEMQQNTTMSSPGQPPQQMQQSMRQTRSGTMAVLAVKDGVPVSVRLTFGNDCVTLMEMGGQKQPIPFPFSGQTITLTRDARGEVAHDFKGPADPMAEMELKSYLSFSRESFPPRPVAVGEEWEPDTAAMRQFYQIGPQDKLSVKCRFVSVKEYAGRRVAEIETVLSFAKRQGENEMRNDMKDTSLVEIDTGNTLQSDMTNASVTQGAQQMQQPGGFPVTVQTRVQGSSRARTAVKPIDNAGPLPATPVADIGGALPGASYAGTFACAEMTVILTGSGDRYTGTIEMAGQEFPLSARLGGGRLEGTFTSGGDRFPFTATLEGPVLTLVSDGTTYVLGRKAGNPLAAPPAKSNPLSQPRLDAAPVSSSVPAASGSAGFMRFKKISIMDSPEGIGGEALTYLAPVGWQVEGGMEWRQHPSMPATVHIRTFNPHGVEQLEGFPTLGFSWGGMLAETGFGPGSNYMGNEVRPPMSDVMQFLQEIIIPRFRGDVRCRIIGEQELPAWAQAVAAADLAETGSIPGYQNTYSAGKVRVEYTIAGQPVEEDLYAVLQTVYVPAYNIYTQIGQRAYGIRAAKGQIDDRTKIMQAMVASVRPNLQWFNKYLQLCQTLHNIEMGKIRTAGKISQIISQTNNEISDMMQQSWERKQASEDRISKAWSQVNRGVEEYYSPVEQRPVELPTGYTDAWVNNAGEYIVSDNVNFNPNVELEGNWQKLERAPIEAAP